MKRNSLVDRSPIIEREILAYCQLTTVSANRDMFGLTAYRIFESTTTKITVTTVKKQNHL